MLPGYQDREFQKLIRKELNLPKNAEFGSCERFEQTAIAGHCIGTVFSGTTTFVLIRGTFTVSQDAVILNLDLPGAPQQHGVEKALDAAGMDPKKTRLIAVCENVTPEPEEHRRMPEIQVVIVPF